MKRLVVLIAISVLCSYLLLLLAKPLLVTRLEKQLSAALLDSNVSIGACKGSLVNSLLLSDIKITHRKALTINIKEAVIRYTPVSLIRRVIRSISFEGVVLTMRMPEQALIGSYGVAQAPASKSFQVNSLELNNISIDVASKDVSLEATLSARIRPSEGLLDSVTLSCNKLEMGAIKVHNAFFEAAQGKEGMLAIEEVVYDKITITSLASKPMLQGPFLFCSPFSARGFGGALEGGFSFTMAGTPQYVLRLKTADANLKNIIHDFDLDEKAEMTGILRGELQCEAQGTGITALRGDFTMRKPGGMLTIKDTSFLERMAQRNKQSLEILVESFKNYHYNIGEAHMGMRGEDIELGLELDGPQGKRAISIVIHDLIKERGT
ncbi:MAG: hypothetical protein AB1530_04440 [Candidatus Omnitrophota bacterium]